MSLSSATVVLADPASERTDILPMTDPSSTVEIPEQETLQLNSILSTQVPKMSKRRSSVIVTVLAGATFVNTVVNGVLLVGLPTMARELGLSESLTFWPSSVFSLACGSCLLLSGNISDVFGGRRTFLVGSLSYTILTLICGLCQTGIQLIVFRAIHGIALALLLPSAMSIMTSAFSPGRWRNFGFAAQGAGQPLGFAFGLTLSGLLLDTIGWRWAFHIATIINGLITLGAFICIPKDVNLRKVTLDSLLLIDWVGAALSATSLALFSYLLTVTSQDRGQWLHAPVIVQCCLATLSAVLFFWWVSYQERRQKPCIFPLSLWKNQNFSAVCAIVFLTWAGFNATTLTLTFVFQDVQMLSPGQTSLRFFPNVVTGILVNVAVGLLVGKISTYYLILIATSVTLGAPILLATMDENASYWVAAFPAMCLIPLAADVLYTVANLVIADAFPAKTQGLAGGVFNTITQLASSVGLGVTGLVAATVTQSRPGKLSPPALMDGYHASFWTCAATLGLASLISSVALRKIGRVGTKRD